MLGARIASLRRQAGLSQAQLAQKLQISASAVGMYEQSRREPSGALLVSMAATFGVSVDYLLTGRPGAEGEQARASSAVQASLAQLEKALLRRSSRPFSRQELTVLFAALLMES